MKHTLAEFIMSMVQHLAEFSENYTGSGKKTIPEWLEILTQYINKEYK